MFRPKGDEVGRLEEPVHLINMETRRLVVVETIEVLTRCENEMVKFRDPRTGRQRVEKIYRDATEEEIELWEEEGRRKRGERQKRVEEDKIRNAPSVIMVNQDSPAAAAVEAAKPKRKRKTKAQKAAEAEAPESE